jgi:TP901 family phage tail tape measure protein
MANKRINATVTIGGALAGSLTSALDTAKGKIGQVGAAVQKLEREQKALNKQIHAYAGYGSDGLDKLLGKHAAVTRELEKQRRILAATKGKDDGKEKMSKAGLALGAVGAVASLGLLPVMEAVKFEKAMLGVAKQVDGARDASGKLTPVYFEMAKQIQLLGREVPMSTEALAEMVAAGARMGVAKDELIEFTRTSAMMAEAFELPAGELADQMGKIKGLFGLQTQKEVRALADSVNYLDDNAISKGGDIIEFLQRTGGVAGAVKISAQGMAALGSTLLTLGEKTQTAGTAVNAMVQKFAAADKGTKKFKSAMKEIGLSTDDVQKGMQVDAQGTILKVMDAVNKLPKEKRLGVMVELVGLEHSDTLAKLAGNVGEYRKQIEMASSQKAEGSMSREFQARLQTTGAQWEILKNRVGEAAVNIGDKLLPHVNKLIDVVGSMATKTGDWIRENDTLVSNVGTVVATLTGAYVAFQLISGGIGLVTFAMNALKLAMATHPILIVGALLATAAILIYKNWEPIKGFFHGMWLEIMEGVEKAITWIMSKVEWVGAKWQSMRAALGLGDASSNVSVTTTPQGPPSPELPKLQMRSGAAVTNTQQNNITIHQLPGQDSKALAEQVARELERKNAIKRRSQIVDGAGVQ